MAALAAIYATVMAAAIAWMPWRDSDMQLFSRVFARQDTLDPSIELIDVASYSEGDPFPQDNTIAGFLRQVVAHQQHPRAIYLDFAFGPCSTVECSTAHQRVSDALASAARKPAEIPVYGVERVPVDDRDQPSGPLAPIDPVIYNRADFAGVGHTDVFVNDRGVLSYRGCYPSVVASMSGGVERTMPVQSIISLDSSDRTCDAHEIPIFVGATPPTFSPVTIARPFPAGADFNNRYVILGSLEHDKPLQDLAQYLPQAAAEFEWLHGPQALDISGPQLIAWELDGRLHPIRLEPAGEMLLLLVPALAALTALVYAACFFLLRRLRLRALRLYVAWLAAGASLSIGLVLFAAVEAFLGALNGMQPQVSLPATSIAVAAALCGVRGAQIMADMRDVRDDDAVDYDVFVSYSHTDEAWVRENVVRPFQQAGLAVFFDRDSLPSGSGWRRHLTLAVLNSAMVVAVYTRNYFRDEERGYCRFELECAFDKWIQTGDVRYLRPIMLGDPSIPPEFSQVQAISIERQPDIVQRLIAEAREPNT